RDVASSIGRPLGHHVDDAQIGVVQVGLEPCRVDQELGGERGADRQEERARRRQEGRQLSRHQAHLTCQRISASVTFSVTEFFSRRTAMSTTAPTLCWPTAVRRSARLFTGWPPIATMISPARIPAFAAGPRGSSLATRTPRSTGRS